MTHLVAPPVPEMIATMRDDWWTATALLAALADTFDLIDADPTALGARLDELAATGLLDVR